MSPRSAASPRNFQLYSPRCPSPLGLPPLTHTHMEQNHTTNPPCSAYPKTPERYYLQPSEATSSHGLRFPPDVHRRPLGNNNNNAQQRTRAPPPAPLSLDAQHHPAVVQLPPVEQPHATQEMRVPSPSSTTSSSTSSLSLYSSDSAKKSLQLGVIQEEEEGEERKKGGGGFCLCFNFSALFGTKSKPNKFQEPVIVAEPAPAPQMVQPRRRPPSLVLVR